MKPYRLRNPYCSKACSNASRALPEESRFLELRDTSGEHWAFLGAHDKSGYGLFALRNRNQIMAHRYAWGLRSGTLPLPDEIVGHTCDTPGCIRTDDEGTYDLNDIILPRFGHLFLGVVANNNEDKRLKGRHSYGVAHGMAKITDDDVRDIRARAADGWTQTSIARDFGMNQTTIGDIIARRLWKHIP